MFIIQNNNIKIKDMIRKKLSSLINKLELGKVVKVEKIPKNDSNYNSSL